MTVIELKAIASAAITGFKNPESPNIKLRLTGLYPINVKMGYRIPAATGIKTRL